MTLQLSSGTPSCPIFATPWTTCLASLTITNSWSLLKLMSIESVMPSNHLILCHPLFLLPSIFPNMRVFSNESALHIRWPKHSSFSFSISPSNDYQELVSFRMDWFDLIAVQGTAQESPPKQQFKSISSSLLRFLYGPTLTSYMPTGKTIALTRQTFVGKVMSLLFNMLSRLVIAFFPRSKCLLISWPQSPCLTYIFSFILHNSGPKKALAHLTDEDAEVHRASVTSTFCSSTPHTKCVAKAAGKLPGCQAIQAAVWASEHYPPPIKMEKVSVVWLYHRLPVTCPTVFCP